MKQVAETHARAQRRVENGAWAAVRWLEHAAQLRQQQERDDLWAGQELQVTTENDGFYYLN